MGRRIPTKRRLPTKTTGSYSKMSGHGGQRYERHGRVAMAQEAEDVEESIAGT